jgi:hypothetical protein
MDLSGLTKNPLFNVATKSLKKTMKEYNLDLVTIRLSADNELIIEPFSDRMEVIKADDLNQLKAAVYGQLG